MSSPVETAGSVGARRPNSTTTYVLEYVVRDRADGVTPAPQFEVEGAIPSDGAFPDEQQIYTFEVDRLGLIDLSLSGILPADLAERPSSLGQRYVTWAWGRDFFLGSGTPLQKANDIVGEGYVDLEALETLPVASTQFYSRKGYVMPQGTVIRVSDMVPSVLGASFLLRFGIVVPLSVRDDALMRNAFCCTESIPTVTDSDGTCVAPTILTPGVDPNQLEPQAEAQTITINAYPVSPNFTTVVVSSPAGPVTPTEVEVLFPDEIRFTAVFTEEGSYDVTVSNGEGCTDTRENAFQVGS